MVSFLIALAVLIGGYFIYGAFIARMFGVKPERKTPALAMADGVDFVSMPTWKVFMIQFLNIAGLGPIFGAIMGVMFGPAAFLWIVLGTIFAGAVHDYLTGMMSVRSNGASLPEIIGDYLGNNMRNVMRVFSLLLLVLVGAVFVYNPADLLAGMTPGYLDRVFWVAVIFAYYILATLLPIDKIIGRFYPIMGFALLFMAVGIMVGIFAHWDKVPEVWDGFYNHRADLAIFPMMFVSIACGAISGFHATQSPMMARCLQNERYGRVVFYGAMVSEGVVALIWAAAAVAFTGGYEGLAAYMGDGSPAKLVNDVSVSWLGTFGGILAVIGVIMAPITSGDTALRSARLIAADFLHIPQHTFTKRLLLTVPVCVLCFLIMQLPYEAMWRYFAWCNQVLAVVSLWAVTVYLARENKPYVVTLIPALFMTAVTATYIMYAPEGFNMAVEPLLGQPIPYSVAVGFGLTFTALLMAAFARYMRRRPVLSPEA